MRKVEILAPAGSYTSLKAAFNAGCDAVYIGGSKFGARAYADNPGEDELVGAIELAHIHNKKIYLTINTLLKNKELEQELYNFLEKYYIAGIDAVIVQDLGVLHFIHKYFPGLDIHASTQMTLTMAQGLEAIKHLGVTRMVNSRELSLEEIRSIRTSSDIEIESFVHGALCYCYSGQCLMSSMIGGRSGNRGRCAQTCRMPYTVMGDNHSLLGEQDKYILSPKDICTLDRIPDLIEAGINSFKIEGRMKRPEYAAGVTYLYGKYVDLYSELGREKYESYIVSHKKELEQDILKLQDLYNRGGFSTGYYFNKNGNSMISLQRPNHSGVLVGTVKNTKSNQIEFSLIEDIYPQDILEIRDDKRYENNAKKDKTNQNTKGNPKDKYIASNSKQGTWNKGSLSGDCIFEFTVKDGKQKGGYYQVNIPRGLEIHSGSLVYRTKNTKLLENLSDQFIKKDIKIPITGKLIAIVGKPIRLTLTCKEVQVEITGDVIDEANSQPVTEEKIRKQMLKTNETAYMFNELEILITGNPFIPLQKLNELRRNGISALESAIIESYHRNPIKHIKLQQENEMLQNDISGKENSKIGIHLAVQTREQLEASLLWPEVSDIYIESDIVPLPTLTELSKYIKSKGKRCFILLPRIFRNATYQYFKKYKYILEDNTIDGYILRNLEEYTFVRNEIENSGNLKEIITDANLYVMNHEAACFWKEKNITKFTAPFELNYNELKDLKGLYYDMMVYGKVPLMVSAQCIVKTATGGNSTYNHRESDLPCCEPGLNKVELIDRFQKSFLVKRHCRECYNTIYNSQCLSLLDNKDEILRIHPANIRLDFTFETADETKEVIGSFIQQYYYSNSQKLVGNNYTRGHFKRGIE